MAAKKNAAVRKRTTVPAAKRALHAAKRVVEQQLRVHVGHHAKHGKLSFEETFDAEYRNIVGVAVGHSHTAGGVTHEHSAAPGEPVLVVLIENPRPYAQVRETLKSLLGARAAAKNKLPIEVITTGPIRAHAQTFLLRPAAAGTSVGNCGSAAGTFGFLARGAHAPRNADLFLVSNTHVLTRSNLSMPNEGICQPGRTDGGSCPPEQIGALERFVPINFGGPNRVDAATARVNPAQVRRELLYMQGDVKSFVPIGATPVQATSGMPVGKSGRSTGVTMGRVLNPATSVIATYGTSSALFADQILVVGNDGNFSDAGDSGALVWTWTPQRAPVGLLFGGANGLSFVNHIDDVLKALDIRFA